MKSILGTSVLAAMGTIILVNALFMLISPKKWFKLPRWIRANGTLTEQKYASGPHSVEVRLAGAAIIAMVVWVVYDSVIGPATGSTIVSFIGPFGAGLTIRRLLCGVTCLGVSACGATMLLKPRWWARRYFKEAQVPEHALVQVIRFLSLPVIGIGIYFSAQCIAVK